MGTLNQVIAIEKGVKARSQAAITELHHTNQKAELFAGLARSYKKKDEDGEDQPPENKLVQYRVAEMIRGAERARSELMEVTARKDWANCEAVADVVVDGVTIIPGAPVTYLLFLEKQLLDLRAYFGNLPVLDPAEKWTWDAQAGLYKTDETMTNRTKKTQRGITLYEATKEHPAQTQMITEDIVVGQWVTTKQSGALPLPDRQAMVERVEKLLNAVKEARETANMIEELPTPNVGEAIFGYIRGGRAAPEVSA
jgi:hypothetical protein